MTIGRFIGAGACVLALAACRSGVRLPEDNREANRAKCVQLAAEGDRLLAAGKAAPAAEKYKDAIRASEDYGPAWNNLGKALMRDQNFYDAQQAFVRAAELLPRDPRPSENLGVLYVNRDLPGEALKHFEESLARDPNYLPSIRGLVRASQFSERNDQASHELIRDHIRRALLLETDPKWREFFQRQLVRVETDLADEARSHGST